jgi:hypothetical protein
MTNDVEQLSILTEEILNKKTVKVEQPIKEERDPSISDDAWNVEYFADIGLIDFLEKTNDLLYEIKNCVRGAKTRCKSRDEIENYLSNLSVELAEIVQGM